MLSLCRGFESLPLRQPSLAPAKTAEASYPPTLGNFGRSHGFGEVSPKVACRLNLATEGGRLGKPSARSEGCLAEADLDEYAAVSEGGPFERGPTPPH